MSKVATKLPSQVQKISDAVNSAIEAGNKPESKPAPVEPAKSVNKVDQEDYKTRFVNYKKATDSTISELRTTLASVQATLAEVQRQNQTLIASGTKKPAAVDTPAVVNTSSELTKDSPVYKQYLDKLPKSFKDEYTEDYLFDQFVMQSIIGNSNQSKPQDLSALEAKVDNVASFQEKTKAQQYEEEMDAAFPNDEWITLANGEKWNAFCLKQISAVDNRTYGDIVKQGSDSHTATSVIWALQEFKASSKSTLDTENNVVDPLLSQVTPDGAGGGGGDPITEINSRAETFTQSQVTQFFTDCATTTKYSAEEATAIEKSIMAAQSAGKIIQG